MNQNIYEIPSCPVCDFAGGFYDCARCIKAAKTLDGLTPAEWRKEWRGIMDMDFEQRVRYIMRLCR